MTRIALIHARAHAVARQHPGLPVMKPNEALVAQAAAQGGLIGLLASFEPTLRSMPAEFPPEARLQLACAQGALEALSAGDGERHDALIAAQAAQLRDAGCHVIALAQFSMARARVVCEQASGLPVLSAVESAVMALRQRLQ